MAPIIILLFLAAITAFGLIYGTHSKSRATKAASWIVTAIPATFLLLVLELFSMFSLRPYYMDEAVLLSGYALLLILWALIISGRIRRKKFWIPFLALCLCFCIATGGLYVWQKYDDSIPEVEESVYLSAYDPWRKVNKLARLDEPAALQLTENLPVLDGATAMYPVYAAFAAETYPEDSLDDANTFFYQDAIDYLRCSTTAGAYEALAEGEADLIFAAAPSDEQIEYAASLGQQFVLTPIGREGFVFFVNAENPIDDLSADQLRGIYSGEITDWKELGAKPGKIRAFQREEGSGSQTTMIRFMGDVPLMEAPMEDLFDGMGDVISAAADYKNYKNAIGYSFRFYAAEMMQNDQIKLLRVSGTAPTTENIANGNYPLRGEFYAVKLSSNDNPNADALIEWILSDQGQELIEKTGYVPLK